MKKLGSLLAIMVLGFGLAACDFSGTSSDKKKTEPGEDALGTEDVLEEEDAWSPEFVWSYVSVTDDPKNVQTVGCQAGNPGADIDAIELYRGGREAANLVATAGDVIYLSDVPAANEATCPNNKNDKDNELEVLGAADGVAGGGVFKGYFSLNGREIQVELWDEDGDIAAIVDGDVLRIVEMHNGKKESEEDFWVKIGYIDEDTDELVWEDVVGEVSTGEVFIEITWEG